MNVIFQGEVNTSLVIPNMPVGGEINIHTDADLTVAFELTDSGIFAPSEALVAPGGVFDVPGPRVKLTTALVALVRITTSQP